ncbi:mitochondrial FAD carrier protein flx1 [Coemansia sp. S2]|nr:mitochondrial FAD carrier protein flx1 [Coemansia sp. S2]
MARGRSAELESGASTLSPLQHLIAGATAGALTQCMANPLWVVKTRICTTTRTDASAYRGLFDGLYQVASKEGVRGLYKGLAPGLLGVAHGGLQFMAYEEMKRYRLRSRRDGTADPLPSMDYALMSSSSKIFALAITYPSQVMRSRLQQLPGAMRTDVAGAPRMVAYTGLGDVVRKMAKSEGISGFYKGFGPALLRVLPGNIVTFLVYENIAGFFRSHATHDE